MCFRNAWHRGASTVTCIACGTSMARSDAREYDTYSDRWSPEDKSFESLCEPCDRERRHSPRDGLEDRLGEAGDGTECPRTFVARYLSVAAGADTTRASEG